VQPKEDWVSPINCVKMNDLISNSGQLFFIFLRQTACSRYEQDSVDLIYIRIFISPEAGSQKQANEKKTSNNKYIVKEINTIPLW